MNSSSLNFTESLRQNYNEPVIIKDFSQYGQVIALDLGQYDWSQDIILIAFNNKIILGHLEFTDALDIKILSEFSYTSHCTCLNISPETNLNILPVNVTFGVGGTDFKISIFKSDLKEDTVCKILNGHQDFINDIQFDPENKYLASVSDDNTAKLWDVESYKCVGILYLSSPGIITNWHKNDTSKLLVAEKIGFIRFYNVETQTPILSVDGGKCLSSCHWAPSNGQMVCSFQLGELNVWDLTEPSVSQQSTLLFSEAGGSLKFSPQGELIAALNKLEGSLKIVNASNLQQRFSAPINLPTNISWHYKYPLICIGDDNKLYFWKVNAL